MIGRNGAVTDCYPHRSEKGISSQLAGRLGRRVTSKRDALRGLIRRLEAADVNVLRQHIRMDFLISDQSLAEYPQSPPNFLEDQVCGPLSLRVCNVRRLQAIRLLTEGL